ncbi:MAG TPA: TIGR01777 family oxidoreductase [Longimicrobiales bacterium]|nr:TIGR01777 family oxidoreductase [Longimicrobiales bacterium]
MTMKIAITGASGLLGTAVQAALRERGHAITRVVRSREAARAADAIYWDPAAAELDADGLAGHDAIVNLAGENIAGVWTEAKKARIRRSRVDGTRLLADAIAALPAERRPAVMVNASGVHYFGDRPRDRALTEEDPPGEGFMARLVQDWEAAADPARGAGVRVVHLRFGLVLDPDALLLQATATATRLGLGATFGDGTQPFPWITREDVVRLVVFAIERPALDGPVNAVAPERTTNRDYADTLARVLGRPRVLRIPTFALRMLGDLGRDLTGGAWVVPRKLEGAGYEWRDPRLEPALRRLLDRP